MSEVGDGVLLSKPYPVRSISSGKQSRVAFDSIAIRMPLDNLTLSKIASEENFALDSPGREPSAKIPPSEARTEETTVTTLNLAESTVFVPRATATRLRLTTRGRRVVASIAALPAVVALAFAIVSGGGALASGEGSAPAGTFDQVTVMPGDTLWSIAESVAPGSDPRDVVDAIMRLNALPSGSLTSGESLSIPLEYSAGR